MISYQKIGAILQCDNFGIDFKNLIGVILANWGTIKPALFFEDTKMGKQIISTLLVSMAKRIWHIDYPKITQITHRLLRWHEICRKKFCLTKWKGSKLAIFCDFESLLLVPSKICPHPPLNPLPPFTPQMRFKPDGKLHIQLLYTMLNLNSLSFIFHVCYYFL